MDAAANVTPAMEPPAAVSRQTEAAGACPGEVNEQSKRVLEQLRMKLPGTAFKSARPSCMPGFFFVEMEGGITGYADRTARYLIVGLALDTDQKRFIDKSVDGQTD